MREEWSSVPQSLTGEEHDGHKEIKQAQLLLAYINLGDVDTNSNDLEGHEDAREVEEDGLEVFNNQAGVFQDISEEEGEDCF